MKIYVSIPITGRPLDDAKAHAKAIAEQFAANGHDVITPFDVCPDSTKPYSYCMGRDIEALLVCDACKRNDVKLVYASSSKANPCNTTSLYGISKHFDEEYARLYNPKATGVRLHNVYGPNPRQGTLLWHLTHDNPVKLMNRGHNERHFTYLDDVVEGLIYAYGCSKHLINVANPEKTTIYDFAVAVQAYKPFDIVLVNEKREFDRIAQEVDESIFTVPLPYTSVENGLKTIFNG